MSRKKIEEFIYTLSDDMDPSGANRNRYESFFATLSDADFYKEFKKFIKDPDANFKIMYPPMNDKSPTLAFFHKIANKRNVELYEYIYLPHLNKTTDKELAPGTTHKMMVLPLNIKRLVQSVFSKNSTSTTITDRNMETGQVKDTDKHGRLSDVEVTALLAQNQYYTAIEYMNPRADDMHMKRQMLNAISNKGEVSLNELDSDITNKVAVNTMNYYMIGSGLSTNLIDTNGLLLPITIKDKEEVKNSQSIK